MSELSDRFFSKVKLPNPNGRQGGVYNIYSDDEIIRLAQMANVASTVNIHGESGTGKEVIAKAIHANSNRAKGPFVAVNCAALPTEIVESELFGHRKGGFTDAWRDVPGRFLSANKGTIFLDEIGDLNLTVQAKILRTLQERTISPIGADHDVDVDVRIIVATNKDLNEEVAQKRFREDLFYRVNVLTFFTPPLRRLPAEHKLGLAQFMLDEFLQLHGYAECEARTFSDEALDVIKRHAWPGNIRELRNGIERGLVMSRGTAIEAGKLVPIGQFRDVQEMLIEQLATIIANNETNLEDAVASLRDEVEFAQQGLTGLARKLRDKAHIRPVARASIPADLDAPEPPEDLDGEVDLAAFGLTEDDLTEDTDTTGAAVAAVSTVATVERTVAAPATSQSSCESAIIGLARKFAERDQASTVPLTDRSRALNRDMRSALMHEQIKISGNKSKAAKASGETKQTVANIVAHVCTDGEINALARSLGARRPFNYHEYTQLFRNEYERNCIEHALRAAGGIKSKAMKQLGMLYVTLTRKCSDLGIDVLQIKMQSKATPWSPLPPPTPAPSPAPRQEQSAPAVLRSSEPVKRLAEKMADACIAQRQDKPMELPALTLELRNSFEGAVVAIKHGHLKDDRATASALGLGMHGIDTIRGKRLGVLNMSNTTGMTTTSLTHGIEQLCGALKRLGPTHALSVNLPDLSAQLGAAFEVAVINRRIARDKNDEKAARLLGLSPEDLTQKLRSITFD
jgi:DNA-binding NtrC family response regulator